MLIIKFILNLRMVVEVEIYLEIYFRKKYLLLEKVKNKWAK